MVIACTSSGSLCIALQSPSEQQPKRKNGALKPSPPVPTKPYTKLANDTQLSVPQPCRNTQSGTDRGLPEVSNAAALVAFPFVGTAVSKRGLPLAIALAGKAGWRFVWVYSRSNRETDTLLINVTVRRIALARLALKWEQLLRRLVQPTYMTMMMVQ